MTTLLWIAVAFWALLFVQLSVNLATARSLRRIKPIDLPELPISVVVPARNEEDGIERAVRSFCEQSPPAREVIVVDDRSTDGTRVILDRLATEFPRLRVVDGTDPPTGWLGKPNALETGRRLATSEWLVFVDADIEWAPDTLGRALRLAIDDEAGMVFLMPRLRTEGFLECALISHLYVASFAALPLWLVRHVRNHNLAVGGGVFNMVRRDALEAAGAFASLRAEVIDDVRLGQLVKKAGHRQTWAIADRHLELRMYPGARATIEGFGKNGWWVVERLFWVLPLIFFVAGIGNFLPPIALGLALVAGRLPDLPTALACGLTVGAHLLLAIRFRQPWYLLFTNPVRELGWWYILLRSWWRWRRRGVEWRGRSYDIGL